MESMESIHRLNGYFCFFIGVGLNTWLVWLVRKRSPVELRPYSRLLLQTAVIDLVYLTITFVYMPVSCLFRLCHLLLMLQTPLLQIMIISDGAVVVYGVGALALNGLASPLSNKWNFVCISACYYMLLMSQCSVAVPFLYRYFAVCRY